MALPKYDKPTNYVRQLADRVVGDAEGVKYAMDRFGEEFVEWFNNDFQNGLKSTEKDNSGADNIGATPILPGVDTVQKALVALLEQIHKYALGEIPDGTITDDKLSNAEGDIKQRFNSHLAENASLDNLGHVKHAVLTATLDTTWEGETAPYTKTITVDGILESDVPIIDVVSTGDYETDTAILEAWGYIYRAVTGNGTITFYATEKPTVSLPIQIRVVR